MLCWLRRVIRSPLRQQAHFPAPAFALSDTVKAEGYRSHLEWIARQHIDSVAKVSWPQDPQLCQQAYQMLLKYRRGQKSYGTASLFLYRLRWTEHEGYILLWPNDPQYSEWSDSCWYDENWKQRGVCMGV